MVRRTNILLFLALLAVPATAVAQSSPAEAALAAMKRGHELAKEGRVGASCGAFDEAARLLPTWWIARYERARCGRALGHSFDVLVVHARAALEHAPGGSVVWALLGGLHEDAGHHDEAVQAYTRALELDPRLVDARLRLAVLRQEEGRGTEAQRLFEAVLKQKPFLVRAWAGLADAALLARDYAAAEKALLTLAACSNYPPAVYARLVKFYRDRGMKSAEAAAERAWRQAAAGQTVRPSLRPRIR